MQNDADVIDCDYTITEMATLHNVSFRALRFYEQTGLLSPVRLGSARLYKQKDRIRLHIILTGKHLGFSLKQIGELLKTHISETEKEPDKMTVMLSKEMIDRQLSILEEHRAEVEAAIEELRTRLV